MTNLCCFCHKLCLTVTEHEDRDWVILTCSVSTSEECHHTVKWRIKGQYVDKDNKQTVIAQTDCSTTLSFLESHNIYPSRYNIVCEVTDTDTGKMQQFTVKHQLLAVEETGNIMINCLLLKSSNTLLILSSLFFVFDVFQGGTKVTKPKYNICTIYMSCPNDRTEQSCTTKAK